jgi:hypothetical protein
MPVSPKWSLSLRFPCQNPVCTSPLPHMCYTPNPSHSSRFDHPNHMCEEYRSLSSSLCSLLHSSVTLSLLGPNILLSTLFSNTHSLQSSLNVRDYVTHPYRTTCKIIVLHLYIFGWQTGRHKILQQMIASIPWFQSVLNFFLNGILIC